MYSFLLDYIGAVRRNDVIIITTDSSFYAFYKKIICPHSVDVARYAALIWTKSPTNYDAHLAESIFQTRSSK